MRGGTTETRGKSNNERPGKNENRKIADSLRKDVRLVANRKDGVPCVIHIAVGDIVGTYRRDITFVPTLIHLREKKYNPSGKPDSVQWTVDTTGTSAFTLKFQGPKGTPFDEGSDFNDRKPVGTVKDNADAGNYHYVLKSLTIDGKPIDIDPMHCPEIIIQR